MPGFCVDLTASRVELSPGSTDSLVSGGNSVSLQEEVSSAYAVFVPHSRKKKKAAVGVLFVITRNIITTR